MTLFQDLRYAVRMLLKDPWFTIVAATALGLGIGVNTTVFTFVNAVFIRGLPFDQSDEIVFLATHDTTRDDDGSPASWQEFEEWRAKTRSFSGLAAFRPQQMNVSDPDHPAERVSGAAVTANTFGLLRQQPFLGRDFAPGEDAAGAAPVVILGYSVWKNRYGSDPGVIGRTLKINEVGLLDHRRDAGRHAVPDQRGLVAADVAAHRREQEQPEHQRVRPARARQRPGARPRSRWRPSRGNSRRPIPRPTRTSKRG